MAKNMKQISKTPQQNKKIVVAKSVKTEPIVKRKKLQMDEFDHEFEKTLKERKNKKPKVEIEEEDNDEDEVESDVDSGDEDLDDEDSNDEGDEDDDDEDDDEFGSDDDEDESIDEDEDETEMPAKKFKKANGKDEVEKEVKNVKAEGKKEKKKEKKDIPQPSQILKPTDPDIKKANINFEERNERCLYVKMLPTDWTDNDIKKLHPAIKIVRMVRNKKKNKPMSRKTCFLEFASVAVMEQAMVKIREDVAAKGGVLDYAGKNSEYIQNKKNKMMLYTPLKLFVTGFELDTTTYGEILKMFSKATSIVGEFAGNVTSPKTTRKLATESCVVCFKLEKDCKEALSSQLTTKSGAKLLLQYSRANKSQMRNQLKRLKKTASKKRKRAEKKEGSVKTSEVTPKKPSTQGKNKSTPKAKPTVKQTPKSKETPQKQNGQAQSSQEKKTAKKNKNATPNKSPVLKSPQPVSGQKRKAPENNRSAKKTKN